MAQLNNYPEMHGTLKSNIQARYSSLLGKYIVTSKEQLSGRGIKFDEVIGEFGANNTPNKTAGWFRYYVTTKAWEKLCADNDCVLNILLD